MQMLMAFGELKLTRTLSIQNHLIKATKYFEQKGWETEFFNWNYFLWCVGSEHSTENMGHCCYIKLTYCIN